MATPKSAWIAAIFLLLSLGMATAAQDEGTRLLRYPDISEKAIVFVYGGNIWTVGLAGGEARKLTSHPGFELLPKFSPDGAKIAFSAQYDGNVDVYVMPAEGGIPKRLTWHPDNDRVIDWLPSGDKVLILSRAASWKERFERYFTVDLEGHQPELLPLPEGSLASFSPDGKKLVYNRISTEMRTWKRYRGGMAPDIWIYDFTANRIERIVDNASNNQFPMWYRDRIYFISDREHCMNIFCYDLKTKKTTQVTSHSEYDVKWPSLGGGRIVYENGGVLWVLDLETHQTRQVPIHVADDGLNTRPRVVSVERFVHSGGISPTGKRVVMAARGDIFTIPAEKGNGRNLTDSPGIREKEPTWSPDGKWIAYYSDRTGEYEVYLRASDGTGEETRLTTDGVCFRNPMKWSPDSKKLLYSDSRMDFYYLDIDGRIPLKFDHDKWGHTPTDYDWSGDSNWIVYSKGTSRRANSLYLYNLKDKTAHLISTPENSDFGPAFDREGKYLFFASQRNFSPTFSEFDGSFIYRNSIRVFAVPLQKDAASPLAPESDEEEVKKDAKAEPAQADKKDTAGADKKVEPQAETAADKTQPAKPEEGKAGEAKKDEKKEEKKEWKIDLDGLAARAVCLNIPAGIYGNLSAGEGVLFFLALGDGADRGDDNPGGGTIKMYDFKKREIKDVLEGIAGFALSANGKKILYATPSQVLGIIDAQPGAKPGAGKLSTADLRLKVDPTGEWKQIFADAWRNERDFFYDPNMHGVDWKKIRQRYERLLPWCAHRDDLNYLLGEMLGELDCGHTYVRGGDMPAVDRVSVGLLGLDLAVDTQNKRYRIGRVLQGEGWESRRIPPLAQPGLKAKPGDYIIAVNGREVHYPENFYSFFEDTVDKQVKLTLNDKPEAGGAWDVIVKPTGSEQQLRYIDQVEANRAAVEKATRGKVGYIHVPSTGVDGLNEFYKGYVSQFDKEGLIIDVRYNNGGMVPDRFIEILRRPLMSYWGTQQSESFTTPDRPTPPYLVCIINAYAGSGGDAFPYFFKLFKLGPLVGMRTWGGLVGISRNLPFTDNGQVTMPDFGIYNTAGQWVVENHGVDPDIEVDNRPDLVVAGHDPQLEKAIEVIMDKIRHEPVKEAPKPSYPVRN